MPLRAPCMRLFRLALAAWAPIALTAWGQTQAPPQGRMAGSPYAIAGTVVNSVTGEPIRHATVAALSEEDSHTVAAVESDSEGKFSLANLPTAKYQLTASKRGYRTAFYDEHDEFNSAIVTGPGQETGNLVFRLVPGGVIHGVVTADSGDPVENARVFVFIKSHDGKPGTRIVQSDATTTDDTGAYEFNNLAAGEYMLAVTAEPWYALHHAANRTRRSTPAGTETETPDTAAALDVAYPVTYFDSTPDEAGATVLTIAGGNRLAADITLHAVPALHLQVDTPRRPDGSLARAELRQTIFGEVISAESSGFLDALQSGSVEFTGVAPGHYELAQGDPPRVMELDATASQEVDPSLGSPTVSVRGTMRTQVGTALTEDCSLTLDAVDPTRHQNSIQTAGIRGGFNFSTVPPGEWELSATCGGSQAAIASVTEGNRIRRGNRITVQDRPVVVAVVVSQGGTRLEGYAKKGDKGASGAMIVLVPKDLTTIDGLARRDQSDSDGSFSLRDVIPGQYTLVAIEDGWPLDWMQPTVIGRYLPGGVAVTVSDRTGKVTTLPTPVEVEPR